MPCRWRPRADGFAAIQYLDDDDLTLGQYHAVKSSMDGTATRFVSPWPLEIAGPMTELLRPMLPMGDLRLSRRQLERSLQNRWYDTSRLRRETGWRPRVTLAEAVQRTLAGRPAEPYLPAFRKASRLPVSRYSFASSRPNISSSFEIRPVQPVW